MNGLQCLIENFGMTNKDLAERIGVKVQQVHAWVRGDRPIPKKHMKSLGNLEEFEELPYSYLLDPELFLQNELHELEVIDVQMLYYQYLAKKEGIDVEQDSSHPYTYKLSELKKEMDIKSVLMEVEGNLNNPELEEYPNFLTLIDRINFIVATKSTGRLEALLATVKLLTKNLFNDNFNIENENAFVKELLTLFEKYELLDEIKLEISRGELEKHKQDRSSLNGHLSHD